MTTKLMRLMLCSIVADVVCVGQTVYLRSSSPASVQVSSVTGGTPPTVTTATVHGLSVGNFVTIGGVCTDSGASAVNGIRKVKATPTTTSITITDLSDVDITAGSSVSCDPVSGNPGAMWLGKATAYTLGSQPLGFLDGLTGSMFRKLALGTQNGLFQSGGTGGIVVSSNVATVTTTYNHGLTSGDKISVWNTTSSALNDGVTLTGAAAPYTVTVTDATHFTFPTSGVADGDYTTNGACGPTATPNDLRGGTANCVRISELAYTGNPFWDAIVSNSATMGFNSGTAWKPHFDGGSINYPQSGWASNYRDASVRFMVDQANDQMLAISTYTLTHLMLAGGGNWIVNQAFNDGGNVQTNQNSGDLMSGVAWAYMASGTYLSSAHLTTLIGQVYNDVDDPNGAIGSTVDADMNQPGHQEVMAGPAVAQSGSSTTITLASSDAHGDNFCTNDIVAINVSGTPYFGLVTGYVASTKVATVTAWVNYVGGPGSPPTTGTPYTVYAAISISSSSAGATATVTGYNTHFTTKLHVGDSVIGTNYWSIDPFASLSYVTVVTDDTHATVINSNNVTATSTPSVAWYAPQWQAGDVGLQWTGEHWQGTSGAQPILYPPNGGNATLNRSTGSITEGANNAGIYQSSAMALDLAMASTDARAIRNLAIQQSFAFDYEIRHYMNYSTGAFHSGGFYNYATASFYSHLNAAILQWSIPTFPSLDMTGQWVSGYPLYKMFATYPDFRWDGSQHQAWPLRIGAQSASNAIKNSEALRISWVSDPLFLFAPTSATAKVFRSFIETNPSTVDLWSAQGKSPFALFWNDPRIGQTDYTTQPHQYLFQASSATQCATVTGWPCPTTFRGNAVVSRSGWSSTSDTMVYYDSRTYWSDHDIPQQGALRIYKVGELLWADGAPPSNPMDGSHVGNIQDNMVQFNNGDSIRSGDTTNQPAIAPITRWASAKAGSWGSAYGDNSSTYAYVCSDLSGAYTIATTYVERCIIHLKKPSTEEIVLQWDSIKPSSSMPVNFHVHYEQTGQTGVSAYTEGNTTYPGAGGCGALNTNRVVQSLENGDGPDNDPQRQYGIVSRFLSPGTVTLVCDGTAYAGGQGDTARVSVCGGTSCADSVELFESLTIHKVSQNLTDTTLVSTALSPDANWYGVQTTDKVALVARGGVPHSTIASFVTSHSGTAQYFFGGFSPGTYAITINSTPVSGSPFTVTDGDNSVEFESTAGTVAVNGSIPSTSPEVTIRGAVTVKGKATVGK